MSDKADNIYPSLAPYGLTKEESQIYCYLLKNSYTSALTLSRNLHISRTKVYRLLDKLISRELVEQKIDDQGTKFGAASIEKFAEIVAEKEHEVVQMKATLPDVLAKMSALAKTSESKSKILYYKGIEGYKQVTYNSTKAKGLLRIIERVNDMSVILPKKFAEDIRQRFVDNKVTCWQISPFTTLSPWTNVTAFVEKYTKARYIPPEKLKSDFEMLVYNDVYAIYNTEGEDTFCIEIYNPELAQMQKQIFDFLWESAQPMIFTDSYGTAKLAT